MTVQSCPGFKTGAVAAGIKKDGAVDLGLIYSEAPASAAALFTSNLVQAAPVRLDRRRIRNGRARALIVNSGNANCCTGAGGLQDATAMAALAAAGLGVEEESVLVASTGVIGVPLPMSRIETAVPALIENLQSGSVMDLARAIMTTDTVPKAVSRRTDTADGSFTVTAVAKGAGMIRPDVATMLCFVMTDVRASSTALRQTLTEACHRSFNRISIDGDTSTNDTVLVLANGRSGVDIGDPAYRALFQKALNDVALELAKWLVKDGEGATKLVNINVRGAADDAGALRIADTVAHSNLVKTALFGEDANWGRIVAAAGRAGVPLDPDRVDVYVGTVQMVADGVGCGTVAEAEATRVLQGDEFSITIDLKAGSGCAEMITCDLSIDYVKINADYRT